MIEEKRKELQMEEGAKINELLNMIKDNRTNKEIMEKVKEIKKVEKKIKKLNELEKALNE